MSIRLLNANEIECRVQSVKKTSQKVGCILLLYKDARVDMKLLDEVYGPENWQRTHELINGNLFCNIEVWDKEKGWVTKQDVGVESNTEKEKGQASDSFKRAGFNWGIGRELYTSPFIWVDLKEGEYHEKDGKPVLNANIKFEVKSIGYNDDREIVTLQIKDNHNIVRYDLKTPSNMPDECSASQQTQTSKPEQPSDNTLQPSDLEKRASAIYFIMTGNKEGQHKWPIEEYKSWLKDFKSAGKITTDYGKKWTQKDVEFLESVIKELPF